MTYRFPIRVGDRVALAPHTDLWMVGVRYAFVDEITDKGYLLCNRDGSAHVGVVGKDDVLGAVGPMPPMPDEEPCCAEFTDFGVCEHQQRYDAFERDTSWRDD